MAISIFSNQVHCHLKAESKLCSILLSIGDWFLWGEFLFIGWYISIDIIMWSNVDFALIVSLYNPEFPTLDLRICGNRCFRILAATLENSIPIILMKCKAFVAFLVQLTPLLHVVHFDGCVHIYVLSCIFKNAWCYNIYAVFYQGAV